MEEINGGGILQTGSADFCCRSLVYVEGDATMNTYQDSEGKNRSALNIVERKSSRSRPSSLHPCIPSQY